MGLTMRTSSCPYTLLFRRMRQPRSNPSQKPSTGSICSYVLVWYPRQEARIHSAAHIVSTTFTPPQGVLPVRENQKR